MVQILNPHQIAVQKRSYMRERVFATALAAALVLPATHSQGQIPITSGNLTYSQDFNSLTRSTTAENWTDNIATTSVNDSPRVIGLVGWYVGNFGTTAVTPQIRAGTGSSATGSFYSFGSTSDPDRALGTLPTDSTASGSMRIGARFVNNSGGPLTGFSFSYDGEQWRNAAVTNVNNQYVVAYLVVPAGSGSLNSGSYSANITSATFNTPFDGTGSSSGAALNGNDSANRVAGLSGTVTGISIADGEEIWLRWWDSNSSGADQGIAIDNFAIAFTIPEPSAVVLTGLGLLSLLRRSRKGV